MRKILTILILALLIGGACAADTLINPTRINTTKSWNSQLHGITNGTAAQDAVTYSQWQSGAYNTFENTFGESNNSLVGGSYVWEDDYVPFRQSVGSTTANSSVRYGFLSYMKSSNILGAGSPVGNTYQRLILDTAFDAYGWGNTVWLTDYSTADTGEHTGFYSRVEGNKGGSQLWGMALEVWDTVRNEADNHNRNIIGMEIVTNKAYGSGLNSGQAAIGLHILAAGNKTQTAGIKIDRQTLSGMDSSYYEDGILIEDGAKTRAINITATVPVGLDFGFGAYSAAAIRMARTQSIEFGATSSIWSMKESSDGTKLEFYLDAARKGYVDSTGWHNG